MAALSTDDGNAKATVDELAAAQPSLLAEELRLRLFKSWFRDDAQHSAVWRREAKEDFDFLDGEQWTPDEKSQLKEKLRPEIVFNRVIAFIAAVAGFEINARHEVQFLPRKSEDTAVNELLTGASKWMADECDGEDEESEAFQDGLTCGMGWCLSDDTLVRLPKTNFATSRYYTGPIIEVCLENGKKLTGTPNHPVLTNKGWKKLCVLNEGDYLVTSAFLERVNAPVHEFDHVETRLEDRVNAFRAGREVGRFITAPNDFYSDGAGSKVHVVYANGFLLNQMRNAARRKAIKNRPFSWRHSLAKWCISFFGLGIAQHALCATVGKPTSDAGHIPRSDTTCSDLIAKFMAVGVQDSADLLSRRADTSARLKARKALFDVKPNDVINNLWRYCSHFLANAKLVASRSQASRNCGSINAEHRPNFRDWKPFLEVEARKFCGGDHLTATTRVVSLATAGVANFRVHDVGTSIGFFIAGDVITSNCEHRLDQDMDPAGLYVEDCINPLEMYWDRAARKKNLVDARRFHHLRKVALSEARQMFPGVDALDLDARWAVGLTPEEETKTIEEKRRREENADATDYIDRDEVHIVRTQWWERENYYLIGDPATNQKMELSESDYKQLQERLKTVEKFTGQKMQFEAVKLRRKVFKQAFIGGKILECGDAPLKDQFSFTCITGHRRRNKGTFFGLVRIMRDPQKWTNKWLSQILFIINSTAKGGVMAEKDAFDDQRQAELSWAASDEITWLKKGSLSAAGATGPKIQLKPLAPVPPGLFQLLEMAINALPDVTGINLELLGQRDVNQPGILEAQRKQAGMTVLATLFDALRRFRKNVGRVRLYFIQNFLSDDRLILIAGQDGRKAVPLSRQGTMGEYTVHVDDAPTSPNQKEANWAIIQPMLGVFKDQLLAKPKLLVEVLRMSPLPERLVDLIAAAVAEPPDPAAVDAQNLQRAGVVAGINRTQAAAEKDLAMAGKQSSTAAYDIAMVQKILEDIGLTRAKTDHTRAATAGEHADALATHIGTAVDALSPIPHAPPGGMPAPPGAPVLQ